MIKDCPCDVCPRYKSCKVQKVYCSAFTGYINTGRYEVSKVGKRLKKL